MRSARQTQQRVRAFSYLGPMRRGGADHRVSFARYLRDASVFAPCYVLLDWASYLDPLGPFNITPWNPQPALAIVWMMFGGLVHAPIVLATIVLADVVVRGAPAGLPLTVASAFALTVGYTALAGGLRDLLQPLPALHTVRQLTAFTVAAIVGAAGIGAAFVGVLQAAALLGEHGALEAWVRFSIGDAVGMLVTVPLLLVAAQAPGRRALAALARRPEAWVQAAVVAATLWFVFAAPGGAVQRYFYLLFVPLIWIAARGGMAAAAVAIAIVQVGVVLGLHLSPRTAVPVIEVQALVAAFAVTGLYLGVMVDERERAAETLRQSLRLAAAGEMAGAIAHEVNQPLTALTNYGRSAQLMLARDGRGDDELAGVITRMLAEAQRAGAIVRRVRDFFRSGTTRLEPVPAAQLIEHARTLGEPLASRGIRLTARADDGLAPLHVDRLQIELVLRNLIDNAADAIDAHDAPLDDARARAIEVIALHHDARHARIVVRDTGPGLTPAAAGRAFEPFVSGKATGLGLGLAVSRAIAEAHGGSLEAVPGAHGEFHLVLPLERAHA